LHHSPQAFAETHRIEKIGVQLYTVRDAMKGDFSRCSRHKNST